MCCCCFWEARGRIYTANYGGSSFSALALGEGGEVGEVVHLDTFPLEGEQCRDASHPHHTAVRGEWVWVVDLGCDVVRTYRAWEGGLEARGVTRVEEGAGPRHLALHPTLPLAFLACELQSRVQVGVVTTTFTLTPTVVQVYRTDATSGSLTLLQDLPFSSTESDAGAEILIQV